MEVERLDREKWTLGSTNLQLLLPLNSRAGVPSWRMR